MYFSLTTAALVFFWLGPRTLLHCRSLQRASSSNALNIRPVEKGGKIAALVRMKSASSPEEGKLAFRLKAFGIVSKTASTLLSIFFVTNGEASSTKLAKLFWRRPHFPRQGPYDSAPLSLLLPQSDSCIRRPHLLSFYSIMATVGTMVNECLRVAGVTVPLWVDLISGILYCFQPVFNCWLQVRQSHAKL